MCCIPSRGTDVSKLRHPQRGPVMIVEDLGFDNVRVREMEDGQEYVCHLFRLTSYRSSERVMSERRRELARYDRLNDQPERKGQRTGATGNAQRPPLPKTHPVSTLMTTATHEEC